MPVTRILPRAGAATTFGICSSSSRATYRTGGLNHVSYKGEPSDCARLRCLGKGGPLRSDDGWVMLSAVVDTALGDLSNDPTRHRA